MATMAEMFGAQPLSMAEQMGLQPVTDETPAAQPPAQPLTFGNRFMRGMKDIGQGVEQHIMQLEDHVGGGTPQMWDPAQHQYVPQNLKHDPSSEQFTQSTNQELQDYARRYAATPGAGIHLPYFGNVDTPRVFGSAVAAAPAMLLGPEGGYGAMAASGAMQGGAIGAAQYDPTNSAAGSIKNTALGAATGAIINPAVGYISNKIASGVSNLADRWKGLTTMPPTVDDVAKLPGFDELPISQQGRILTDAQDQVSRTGKIDPEQLGRKSNLLSNGVTPTDSMVSRDPGAWTQERNYADALAQSPNPSLSAQGKRLLTTYKSNAQALTQKLQGLSDDLPDGSSEALGNQGMKIIHDIDRSSQSAVSDIYKAIKEQTGDAPGAQLNKTLDAINDLSTSPAADPIVDAAHRFMVKKMYLTPAEGGSMQPNGALTISEAEALRQHISAQPNTFGKRQLLNALDSDVIETSGGDAFSPARVAAKARFEALDNPAVQKVINAYGELQQGKTAQNFIRDHLINAPVQDVQALVDTVNKFGSQEQKFQFQKLLEAGTLRHLEDQAVNPIAPNPFSGTKLESAINDIGMDKLSLFMGSDRLAKLDSLRQAAIDATVPPAFSRQNFSGSGSMVLGQGNEGLLGRGLSAGINNYLPGIAHELIPSSLTNAPQNLAARSAVNDILAARGVPLASPPNELIRRIGRTLATGAGAGMANKFTQPSPDQAQ